MEVIVVLLALLFHVTPSRSTDVVCRPLNDTTWGLKWPPTAANSTSSQPCPGGPSVVTGQAVRECTPDGEWSNTNVTQCSSYAFMNLKNQIADMILFSMNFTQAPIILQSLVDTTLPGPTSLLPQDIGNIIDILCAAVDLLNIGLQTNIPHNRQLELKVKENIPNVINNLLNETNSVGWEALQTTVYSNQFTLMQCVEDYGLYLVAATSSAEGVVLSRSSIVIQASAYSVKQADIQFPSGNTSELFSNATFSASDVNIIIPGALLLERGNNSTSLPVVHIIVKLPYSTGLLGPLIISSQVGAKKSPLESTVLKSTPVTIKFSLSHHYIYPECSFWNFTTLSSSTQGIVTSLSQRSYILCYSTHLTTFVMALNPYTAPDIWNILNTFVAVILYPISMICLLLTTIFYLTLGRLVLVEMKYFAHLNLSVALFLAFGSYTVTTVVIEARQSAVGCTVLAAFTQYLWLSAFCWMMCEGLVICFKVVAVFGSLEGKWYNFLLLGWVLPMLPVVIGLAVRSENYVQRDTSDEIILCFLSPDKGTNIAFYIPAAVVLMVMTFYSTTIMLSLYLFIPKVNFFLFIVFLAVLCRQHIRERKTKVYAKKENIFFVCAKGSAIVLPLLGVTWLLNLVQVGPTVAFLFINSLQGPLIFILYVLRHEKIWGRLTKKYKLWKYSKRAVNYHIQQFVSDGNSGMKTTASTAMLADTCI